MNDKLQSNNTDILEKVSLSEDEKKLMDILDELYPRYTVTGIKPSSMLLGAIFAIRVECGKNPDMLAQTANSLREIVYHLKSLRNIRHSHDLNEYDMNSNQEAMSSEINNDLQTTNKKQLKKIFNSDFPNYDNLVDKINALYEIFSDMAHHKYPQTPTHLKALSKYLDDFVMVMLKATRRQDKIITMIKNTDIGDIELNNSTDKMHNEQKAKKKITLEEFKKLISTNRLSIIFFYDKKADKKWLSWLWANGFLDTIIEAAKYEDDESSVEGELGYLQRVAEIAPKEVATILQKIIKEIPDEIHNTHVIGCLVGMTSWLPAPLLELLVDDIDAKKWIPQINKRQVTYMMPNYKQMLETLVIAKKYKCLLTLATNLMVVVDKEEVKQLGEVFTSSSLPFYYDRLSYDNIWQHLADIKEDTSIEQALDLATTTMANIIKIRDKYSKKGTFKYHHSYGFETFNFFTLKLDNIETWRLEQEQVKLVVLIKLLFESLINKHPKKADFYYTKYIGDYNSKNPRLPDTHVMWRLRLCLLSISPKVFSNKLKGYFSRLFATNHYFDIIGGAEYERALKECFPYLSKEYQRKYFNQMMKYFTSLAKNKPDEAKHHLFSGSQLLSMISEQLSPNEIEYAKKCGLIINPNYEPAPIIQIGHFKHKKQKAPITEKEFAELSIAEIVGKLCNDWKPDNLAKSYPFPFDDSPWINESGVINLLTQDIAKRLQDYINESNRFFDPQKMDASYTHSYFWGISKIIQEKRQANSNDLSDIDWSNILRLCVTIIVSAEKGIIKEESRTSRAGGITFTTEWKSIYSVIAILLEAILSIKSGMDNSKCIDILKCRNEILKILKFLIEYLNPSLEFKQKEKLSSQQDNISGSYLHTDNEDTSSRSSYSIAESSSVNERAYSTQGQFDDTINNTRSHAFTAFIYFIYLDARKDMSNGHLRIADDVKKFYENILTQEKSEEIMFLFGYYFNYVYTWDKKWAMQLLPRVFSVEDSKNLLYTAAWKGFLSGRLELNIFFNPEIQELYQHGLNLSGIDYPEQEHYEEPQLTIAEHFALVFIHVPEEFNTEYKLFKCLWAGNMVKGQSHFVNFIGRVFINNSNNRFGFYQDRYNSIRKDLIAKQQLINLWEWIIQNCNDPKVLVEFGYWIPLDDDLFDKRYLAKQLRQTIEKTDGTLSGKIIDEVIIELAKAAPEDTLKIIEFALLGKGIDNDSIGAKFATKRNYKPWKEAIRTISKQRCITKRHIAPLIRELLEKDNEYLDLIELL